tara:strand:- start:5832 stop:6143 length:312 start_codon:yes stop_codon:yes gene_type:complete
MSLINYNLKQCILETACKVIIFSGKKQYFLFFKSFKKDSIQMQNILDHPIDCPYCGEKIEIQLDVSAGSQAYIEDCQVCCRPIELKLNVYGDTWDLHLHRDDD